MEENKTALVDSNTENTPAEESKFNPISFTEGLMPKEETDENVVENTDTTEVKEEAQEDDWSFEDEAAPATDPNEAGRDEVNWARVAAELGLDTGSTKEEIKEALKNKEKTEETKKEESSDNEFTQLESVLNLDDKGLMVEELKARGFADSEIEDYIDRLEDAGTLKYEALKVRNEIRKHIVSKESQVKEEAKAKKEAEAKQIEENKIALQKTIKDREDFYGYNLGKEQKKEVYKYITSGDFYKDLSSSHEEVFEQAMFKLFKERVMSLQSKKGYEDGKSQILDNITSPDLGRTSKPRPVQSKAFDPSQFSKK
jgi:hypothetical protein